MSRKILIHKDQARIIRGNIKRNIIPDRTLENLTFRCTFFPFNQGNWLVVLLVRIQSSQLVCHWENPWQLCSLSLSLLYLFLYWSFSNLIDPFQWTFKKRWATIQANLFFSSKEAKKIKNIVYLMIFVKDVVQVHKQSFNEVHERLKWWITLTG